MNTKVNPPYVYKEVQKISVAGKDIYLPVYSKETVSIIVREIITQGQWVLYCSSGTKEHPRVIAIKKPNICGCLIFKIPGACGGFHGRCETHKPGIFYGPAKDFPNTRSVERDVTAIIEYILLDPSILEQMYIRYFVEKRACIHIWPNRI